jgi:intracellular septation protein A
MRLNLSTTDWVTWHLPVLMGLMFAFLFANMPLIMKHHVDDEAPSSSTAPD